MASTSQNGMEKRTVAERCACITRTTLPRAAQVGRRPRQREALDATCCFARRTRGSLPAPSRKRKLIAALLPVHALTVDERPCKTACLFSGWSKPDAADAEWLEGTTHCRDSDPRAEARKCYGRHLRRGNRSGQGAGHR